MQKRDLLTLSDLAIDLEPPLGGHSLLGDDAFHIDTIRLAAPDESEASPIGEALDAPEVSQPAMDEDITPPLIEDTREPEPQKPPQHVANDPRTIDPARILTERPDVRQAFYDSYYVSGAYKHSAEWVAKVGGVTAEAYALHWFDHHGRFEGYNQGPSTAALNVSAEKILEDRPDVLQSYYATLHHGHHSKEWVKLVGGDTPEDYAKYWYQAHGRWEGYAQTEQAAAENIDIHRLLQDRPDVVDAYYKGFYSVNNDQHSTAWADRVGGNTLVDYAKYWYTNYGLREGYNQRPASQSAPAETGPSPEDSAEAPPVADPSLDPWNHPAIYPDWTPPYPGWRPPEAEGAGGGQSAPAEPDISMEDGVLSIGRSLSEPDSLG